MVVQEGGTGKSLLVPLVLGGCKIFRQIAI
jgi:hypothetical protein